MFNLVHAHWPSRLCIQCMLTVESCQPYLRDGPETCWRQEMSHAQPAGRESASRLMHQVMLAVGPCSPTFLPSRSPGRPRGTKHRGHAYFAAFDPTAGALPPPPPPPPRPSGLKRWHLKRIRELMMEKVIR